MPSRIPKRIGYLLAIAILATFGVRIYFWLSQPWSIGPQLERTNIRDILTIELPPGSQHRIMQGYESAVGEIVIAGTRSPLEYHLGGMDGNFATNESNGPFLWQKQDEFDGVKMNYSLTKSGTLFVTFPEVGLANFFTDLRNDSDTELILKYMRTVRPVESRGPSSLDWEETDLSEL